MAGLRRVNENRARLCEHGWDFASVYSGDHLLRVQWSVRDLWRSDTDFPPSVCDVSPEQRPQSEDGDAIASTLPCCSSTYR